jgi:lambda family phage tail tape measure protein
MRATGTANLQVLNTQATASLEQVAAKYDQARAAAQSYVDTLTRQNMRDIAGMGMGDQNREVNGRRNQREDQFQGRRDQLDTQLRANQITKKEFDEYLSIEAAAHERALAADEIYWAQKLAKQADWSVGASEAVTNYLNSARNVAAQAEQAWSNGFKSMEDALVSFATTGKADFKSMANSIIADMVRIQVRASITSAISGGSGGLSSLIGGISGGLSGSNAASVANVVGGDDKLGSMIGLMGLAKNALGGVYQSPSLSAYSNHVYDKPQMFAFAKGGVFAEEGPEAIMPLRRGADGRLGVAASGGTGSVEVHVHNNGTPATAQVKQTQTPGGGLRIDVMLEQIKDSIADDISTGSGGIARSIEGRFGLRTAVS